MDLAIKFNQSLVISSLDFEKTYNRIESSFLKRIMLAMEFVL